MRKQPRYEPYGASAFYPDGRAMRAPPAGTVARDSGTAIDTARLASSPPPALLERGAFRFGIFCAVCHGERGDGRSVVASNMADRPPPSLRSLRVRSLAIQQLYDVIVMGVGRMPSYAAQLSDRDRWAVAAYIHTVLQQTPESTAAPEPPSWSLR